MITKDTLQQVLLTLGFTQRKGVFSKSFGAATLSVDIDKGAIIAPVIKPSNQAAYAIL
jgi:hypothetical protein